jgi:Holliday junction resolvase RusA-like endonuclease
VPILPRRAGSTDTADAAELHARLHPPGPALRRSLHDLRGVLRMKLTYELTVWDKPRPQARKRIVNRQGKVSVYPASKDDASVYHIRKAFLDDWKFEGEPEDWVADPEFSQRLLFPKGTVMAMSMVARVRCPTSISLKRRREGRAGWPQGRDGDLDNITKAVKDALQGFLFWNDKQIVMYREPYYIAFAFDQRTGEDTRPHLYVRLEKL